MPCGENDVLRFHRNELIDVMIDIERIGKMVDVWRDLAIFAGGKGGHAITIPDIVTKNAVLECGPEVASGSLIDLQAVAIEIDLSFCDRSNQSGIAPDIDASVWGESSAREIERALVQSDDTAEGNIALHAQGAWATFGKTTGTTGFAESGLKRDVIGLRSIFDHKRADRRNLVR